MASRLCFSYRQPLQICGVPVAWPLRQEGDYDVATSDLRRTLMLRCRLKPEQGHVNNVHECGKMPTIIGLKDG